MACLALLPAAPEVHAQNRNIATDGRFSPAQTLTGPTYAIDAGLGRQVGGNLFESFSKFGLASGEQAVFSGPSSVSNVVAGVTGGNVSHIDGTIRSTIDGANLYLINPSGVVFGPKGSIDISGSFHVSNADYVKTSDGTRFDVKNPSSSTVSAAPIAAFGFLNAPVGKIKVHGATLTASPGQGLDMVGGPVSLKGAQLSAPGGTIRIAAANASGEIPVTPGQRSSAPVSAFAPVTISNGSVLSVSDPIGRRDSGTIRVRAASLSITNSELDADNFGRLASAGEIKLHVDGQTLLDANSNVHALAQRSAPVTGIKIVTGSLVLNNGSLIDASSVAAGAAGSIKIKTGPLSVEAGSQIKSESNFAGPGGPISIAATGDVLIDSTGASTPSTIDTNSNGNQPAGPIKLSAQSLSLHGQSVSGPSALTANAGIGGDAGTVTINLSSGLSLNDFASIAADGSLIGGSGAPGSVNISAAAATIAGGATVSARVRQGGLASGGQIAFNAANTTIDGSAAPGMFTGIITATSGALPSSSGGAITVNADNLSILPYGEIAAGSFGPGNGGSMAVNVHNALLIDGTNANVGNALTGLGVVAASSATGVGGSVSAPGAGGSINVTAGSLTIRGNGEIAGGTAFNGNGGQVSVDVAGALTIDGSGATLLSGVVAQGENGSGNAGKLQVSAGSLALSNGGTISVSTTGSGAGGDVTVNVQGAAALTSGATVSSQALGSGNGGNVVFASGGPLSLSGTNTGIIGSATPASTGNAGSVSVSAPQIAITGGAQIASTAAGTGSGGPVSVVTPGALLLDGQGAGGGIAASAAGARSGVGGTVAVKASTLSVSGTAQIASTASGLGNGGAINVLVTGDASLAGSGPAGASGITAATTPGSVGRAGDLSLSVGGALSLSDGAQISSGTAGAGAGGAVLVSSASRMTLSGADTGIIGSAASGATGNAGNVTVSAPQLLVGGGAQIASTMAGTALGGAVTVSVPGVLLVDGAGSQIAASALGPQAVGGGNVSISAGAITVQHGGEITTSTAGAGRGGDINVQAASDIFLTGAGPQITALSTGTGAAGSIAVAARNLTMTGGAAISTSAASANGGDITLTIGDFLHLVQSQITTSVTGAGGNGGNILIDPQFLVLDRSQIIAQAVEGNGGNITIVAGEFIPSADSLVSASSSLGISGNVEIDGPRVDLNGSLVELAADLRAAAAVLRENCASRGSRPRSSLTEAGRGGLTPDPDSALPSLYLAGRDIGASTRTVGARVDASLLSAAPAFGGLDVACR